jgi:hypothetical protein
MGAKPAYFGAKSVTVDGGAVTSVLAVSLAQNHGVDETIITDGGDNYASMVGATVFEVGITLTDGMQAFDLTDPDSVNFCNEGDVAWTMQDKCGSNVTLTVEDCAAFKLGPFTDSQTEVTRYTITTRGNALSVS